MAVMTFNASPADPAAKLDANVQMIEQYLGAAQRRDLGAATALLAEDAAMHVHGRSPIAGDHAGPPAVLSTFDTLRQRSDGTYHVVSTLAWLVMGPHIHHVTAEQATRQGKTFNFNRTTTYEVREGRIAEIRVYEEDQYAFDDFWS